MAVDDFTLRISGVVSYEDGSSESFEASATWKGHLGNVVATHEATESTDSFAQLHTDNQTDVESVLDLLEAGDSGDLVTTIAPPALGTAQDKTVSDFVMEVSGVVSYDDDTKGSFAVQWVNGALDVLPDSESATNYQAVLDVTAARNFVNTVFETVGGSGNVSFT